MENQAQRVLGYLLGGPGRYGDGENDDPDTRPH